MVKIVDLSDINVDQINFHNPQNGKYGGQSIKLTYNDERICIQTPRCYLPFGINQMDTQYGTKYSADLSLTKTSKNMDVFMKFIHDLDTLIKRKAFENTNSWFQKDLSEDLVNQLYKNQTRVNKDFPPILRTKIINNESGPICTFFNSAKETIDIGSINQKTHVNCVIELTGIYFIAKEFGVTWRLIQMMVFPSQTLSSYAFVDDSDDEDTEPA